MAFYIKRELRDRGVRTISRDDILKIMPEVRVAASKISYGSQTEIMAKIVQENSHRNSRAGAALGALGAAARP